MSSQAAKQRKKEIWAGSRLPVSVPLEQSQAVEVEIWVEGRTGVVRMAEFVPAGSSLNSFSDTLLRAIEQPMSGDIYRPGLLLVDRPELAMAVRATAVKLGVRVEVRPTVKADLADLVEELQKHLAGGSSFRFLADADVDPKLVTAFHAQAHIFLGLAAWEEMTGAEVVEIEGLGPEPMMCSIMGQGGEYGLALYLTREAAEMFLSGQAETGQEAPSLALLVVPPEDAVDLKLEMEEHGWKEHPLGVPILVRGDRPDRPHPTNDELRLMTRALEAVNRFAEDPDAELMPFEISTGEVVKVKISEDLMGRLEPMVDFEDPLEAIMALDELWEDGDIEEAASVAAAYLHQSEELDPPITYRLALYLCHLGELDDLDAFWQDLSQGAYPEWYYIGAYLEVQRGHLSSAGKRLKKGFKHDPAVAGRLLGEDEVDDFARLWAPLWAKNPEALGLLRDVAGSGLKKASAPSKKKASKAKAGRKKKG